MKLFRTLTILILALLLAASVCLPAFAAAERSTSVRRAPEDQLTVDGDPDETTEPYYGFEIPDEEYYGEEIPADENPNQPVEVNDLVWLADSMYFDMRTGEFIYPIGSSGYEVRSNTADGMITNGPVSIKGATGEVYRNDPRWEHDLTNITEPGEYVVLGKAGGQSTRLFKFRLVGRTSADVFTYMLPAGMTMVTAKCNDEEIYFERFSVPMQQDGRYQVEYECLSTGRRYGFDVTVDRQPPSLTFSGSIDKKNRVHSALKFAGLQPGDSLLVDLDGKRISVDVNPDGTGELPQSGNYLITVFDAAGNRTQYAYTVMIYLNSSALVFFLILGASILAVVIYILIKRKKLKIG